MADHPDLEQSGTAEPGRGPWRRVRPGLVWALAGAALAVGLEEIRHGTVRGALPIALVALLALAMVAITSWALRRAAEHQRELRLSREELARRAHFDELTGIANRTSFLREVEAVLGEGDAAVLLLDLDDFEEVNDTFGHATGDRLLQEVALRLRACARDDDSVARIGDDEFGIVVRGGGEAGALELAMRLREQLVAPLNVEGREIHARASIGIVAVADRTVMEVLRDADAAKYRAKERAAGAPEVFRAAHHGGVLDRFSLATEFRRALVNDELVLEYQPIVAVADERPVGFEALARWNHPTRGRVSPAEFIPLAERTGLIHDLGAWVLDAACRQCGVWLAAGRDVYVSVNLSGVELRDPSLAERVEETVSRWCDPRSIVLEITESSVVGEIDRTVQVLSQLKASGLRLAIDDFGTGYSSLSYLRRLPVDLVKIDRSFVSGITKERTEWTVARAIIELIRGLDMAAVAEGVEDGGQLAHLRALECHYAQGYYFARPAPADTLE